jgi:hypothetical protein
MNSDLQQKALHCLRAAATNVALTSDTQTSDEVELELLYAAMALADEAASAIESAISLLHIL